MHIESLKILFENFVLKCQVPLKICIKLDINNIEFQNMSILLHSLKIGLFGYIVQKLRLNNHFSQYYCTTYPWKSGL